MMKYVLLPLMAVCVFGGVVPKTPMMVGQKVESAFHEQFTQFKAQFNKVYASEQEELARFGIFMKTLEFIATHNAKHAAGEVSFDVGVNQFADWTNEEFQRFNGLPAEAQSSNASATFMPPSNMPTLPTSVDWRSKGYVTPVKDQKQCGSCWAFSTTGTLEGQHFKKTGKLISLSEQNLVDCAGGKYQNQGCNGGWPYRALDYIKDNGGVDTEQSYQYEARNDKCRYNAANKGATVVAGTQIPKGNEARLQEAVATVGPVSVCIDASHMSFQTYKSGVYHETSCSTTSLDHAVLVVGYGVEAGKDYWLVKNSWNTNWGEAGYIKMQRNSNNACGIASAAVYPVV